MKLALAATVILAAADASAGELVVADVRNVNLKRGDKMTIGQKVVLDHDQCLFLVARDGRTIKITGPYVGTPGSIKPVRHPTLGEALAHLRTDKRARLTEAATVRLAIAATILAFLVWRRSQ